MFINWLKTRKKTFVTIFLDILIFIIIYFTEKNSLKHFSILFFSVLSPWILSSYIYGRYSIQSNLHVKNLLLKIIFKTFIAIFLTLLIMKLVNFIVSIIYTQTFVSIKDIQLILTFGFLSIAFQFLYFYRNNSSIIQNLNILIIGDNNIKRFQFLPSENKFLKNINFLDFEKFQKIQDINEILIIKKDLNDSEIMFCKEMSLRGIPTYNYVKWIEKYFYRTPSELLTPSEFFKSNYIPLYNFQLRLKRIGDILVSLMLLIILLPINLILAIVIKLEDGGPILYTQERNGFKNKPFKILKFRSMKLDAECNGPKWAERNDQRITKVGFFIRKMRLDETPQLINVIAGQMSLIGPRPERPEMDNYLKKEINLYDFRYNLRPGLSGWAQVNFPYGASLNDAKHKLSYDLFYMQKFSFFLDLLILFKTLRLVFNLKGSRP